MPPCPERCRRGCRAQGVPGRHRRPRGLVCRPFRSVFAAFLGFNPLQTLLEPTGVLARLPAKSVQTLTGKEFFPHLISQPFHHGLVVVFTRRRHHGDGGGRRVGDERLAVLPRPGRRPIRQTNEIGDGEAGSTVSGLQPWQDASGGQDRPQPTEPTEGRRQIGPGHRRVDLAHNSRGSDRSSTAPAQAATARPAKPPPPPRPPKPPNRPVFELRARGRNRASRGWPGSPSSPG